MQAFRASFKPQWVVLAYLLPHHADRRAAAADVRATALLLSGIALFTSASVLAAERLAAIARVPQGLGAALMIALTLAFVAGTVRRTGSHGPARRHVGDRHDARPLLGSLLIAGLGWRRSFSSMPLGLLTFASHGALPARSKTAQAAQGIRRDGLSCWPDAGRLALAMTLGRGNFGALNVGLLTATALGIGLFAVAQRNAKNPLIQLASFRDPRLSASLAMSLIVATVMMATLVVAPFYLSRGLGLDAAMAGVALSTGPLVSTLSALLAERLADRFGAHRMMVAGLLSLATGTFLLSLAMTKLGIASYVVPITVTCVGYALFQTSNNAAVMTGVGAGERGVVSGLLNLSRNLGLITGASLMGAVFAIASAGSAKRSGVLNSAAARGIGHL